MNATRNSPRSRSLAFASRTAPPRPATSWIGTMSSHMTALLASEAQKSGLVSRYR
ncbi:hypothetical protein [Thermocatellispora tengchongensis]|uniref:hypothetical protein n=1 Tax=Thermocatellispora tengchongensis TaxID=1073253 RepID=UPI0036332BA6